MIPDLLTTEELSALRKTHRVATTWWTHGANGERVPGCHACLCNWPCLTVRLLSHIDMLETPRAEGFTVTKTVPLMITSWPEYSCAVCGVPVHAGVLSNVQPTDCWTCATSPNRTPPRVDW